MLVRAGVGKLNFGLELEFTKLEFQNQSNKPISLTRILFTKKFFKINLNSKFCLIVAVSTWLYRKILIYLLFDIIFFP